MSNIETHIIGAAIGLGGPNPGPACAPDYLAPNFKNVTETLRDVLYKETIQAPKLDDKIKALEYFSSRLADSVRETCTYSSARASWNQPWVIGGDHTSAIGTWNGVQRAFSRYGPIGLIWMDAHMDAHTPESSPSGNLHGMPLAVLLGHGEKELINLGVSCPILKPENVCLIGVRDYQAEEKELLDNLGVKYFTTEEVRLLGMSKVMEAAKGIVKKNSYGYGVSIDLDVLDPHEFISLSTPAPDGLSRAQLIEGLSGISKEKDFVALEIAEFNPYSHGPVVPSLHGHPAKFIEDLLIHIGIPRK